MINEIIIKFMINHESNQIIGYFLGFYSTRKLKMAYSLLEVLGTRAFVLLVFTEDNATEVDKYQVFLPSRCNS